MICSGASHSTAVDSSDVQPLDVEKVAPDGHDVPGHPRVAARTWVTRTPLGLANPAVLEPCQPSDFSMASKMSASVSCCQTGSPGQSAT